MRAIIENMILPDYVLCYVPRVLENFGSMLLWLWVIICKVVGNLWGWEGYIILKPRQLLYLQTWFSESQPAKFGVRAYIILTQQFFWNRIAENHNEDHPRIEKCTDTYTLLKRELRKAQKWRRLLRRGRGGWNRGKILNYKNCHQLAVCTRPISHKRKPGKGRRRRGVGVVYTSSSGGGGASGFGDQLGSVGCQIQSRGVASEPTASQSDSRRENQ